jgi:NAD(P)-dependent dehydrogenase (short-subunit alcohol dehydrogenase family)
MMEWRATSDTREDLRHEVNAVSGNLGDEAVVQEVVRSHRERFARLDVLVNNAGVGVNVDEIQAKRVDLQFAVNLRSPILFYRECAEMLRAAGCRASLRAGDQHVVDLGQERPAVAVGL